MEDKDAYSIKQFCSRHGLSISHYFAIAKAGQGPRVMRVGARVLISNEAAADWRRERETRMFTPSSPNSDKPNKGIMI